MPSFPKFDSWTKYITTSSYPTCIPYLASSIDTKPPKVLLSVSVEDNLMLWLSNPTALQNKSSKFFPHKWVCCNDESKVIGGNVCLCMRVIMQCICVDTYVCLCVFISTLIVRICVYVYMWLYKGILCVYFYVYYIRHAMFVYYWCLCMFVCICFSFMLKCILCVMQYFSVGVCVCVFVCHAMSDVCELYI